MGKEIAAFDYEEERKKFKWDIPEDYNFVEVIRRCAKDRTKLMAITEHPDGKVERAGYGEVWNSAMRFGNVLRDSGIQKGDRILVILPRGTDVYGVSIGIWAIGGVVVHFNCWRAMHTRHRIIRFFDVEFGVSVREGYGQTETCVIACNLPGMEIKPGSMGRFTPGVEGAIVNPENC